MCAYNFGNSGHNLTKLYQGTWLEVGVITCTLIFARGVPNKIWEGKNVQNPARFLTTFDFDHEYLRKGSRYRKLKKYLINYISSLILDDKNLMNFGPLTKKL